MTVSRVLNGGTNMTEQTRSKVLAAIEAIGYRPSAAARALVTRRAMRIGVIVHEPTQFGPKSTLIAIERAARDVGYSVAAYSISSGDDDELDRGVTDLEAQGVDAICVIGPGGTSMHALQRAAATMPVLVVGSGEYGRDLLRVGVDQSAGAHRVMEHLLELGHRRILHLAGPLDTADAQHRELAWRESIQAAKAPIADVMLGDWSADFGFEVGARRDLGSATAVFSANDQMALGLIHGLWTRGIRVPDDISVVGFDDLPESAHFIPPLTTVRQDFEALGSAILETVMAALHGERPQAAAVIPATLIVRRSTSPVRVR